MSNDPNTPLYIRNEIKNLLNSNFTHQEIIKEVKSFLLPKSLSERNQILLFFDKLISKIIQADGHNHPSELDFQRKWKEEFKNF